MTSTSHSVAKFAARFCNELDVNKNCICSPLSVETLLALLALGSSNDTRVELLTALDMPNNYAVRSTFSSLTKTLDFGSFSISHPLSFIKSKILKTGEVTLKIATKIYVKQGGSLKLDRKKDAVTVFRSSLEQIDFIESSTAANTINSWVAEQTNNIIKDIVSPDMFDQDTGLVLVNAIYFHGLWQTPFKPEDSYDGTFHVNNTTDAKIRMMSVMDDGGSFYKKCPDIKAKILQMFYKGGEASMVIILPDEIEALSTVMHQLSAGYDLMASIRSLKKTPLKIDMPIFKVETKINLKQLLPKMGIETMFNENKAEINMLTSNERLYVSEAIQKAYIVVDEIGTEAAAATQTTRKQVCLIEWLGETFVANRPFLYLLTARDIPIFYGVFRGIEN